MIPLPASTLCSAKQRSNNHPPCVDDANAAPQGAVFCLWRLPSLCVGCFGRSNAFGAYRKGFPDQGLLGAIKWFPRNMARGISGQSDRDGCLIIHETGNIPFIWGRSAGLREMVLRSCLHLPRSIRTLCCPVWLPEAGLQTARLAERIVGPVV